MVFSKRLRRVPGQNSVDFLTNTSTDRHESSQKDTFDVLYDEGVAGEAKIMSVILHPHIIGRGGRLAYFEEFLKYSAFLAGLQMMHRSLSIGGTVTGKPEVWIARRDEIAAHWAKRFPYDPKKAFGQTKQVPC